MPRICWLFLVLIGLSALGPMSCTREPNPTPASPPAANTQVPAPASADVPANANAATDTSGTNGSPAADDVNAPAAQVDPSAHQPRPAPEPEPAKPLAEPLVTLLGSGSEPRRALRYAPPARTQASFEMIIGMNATFTTGPQVARQSSPTMVYVMQVNVEDIDAQGTMRCAYAYTNGDLVDPASVPADMHAQVRGPLQSIIGTKGTMIINNRGIPSIITSEIPDGADPMVPQQLKAFEKNFDQYCVPLPHEPVGVGAQWQVRKALDLGTFQTEQVMTYTLQSLSDDGAVVGMSLSQQSGEQRIEDGNGPGVPLIIKSMKTLGVGSSRLHWHSAFPASCSIEITTQTIIAGQGGVDTVQESVVSVQSRTIGPVEGGAATR